MDIDCINFKLIAESFNYQIGICKKGHEYHGDKNPCIECPDNQHEPEGEWTLLNPNEVIFTTCKGCGKEFACVGEIQEYCAFCEIKIPRCKRCGLKITSEITCTKYCQACALIVKKEKISEASVRYRIELNKENHDRTITLLKDKCNPDSFTTRDLANVLERESPAGLGQLLKSLVNEGRIVKIGKRRYKITTWPNSWFK